MLTTTTDDCSPVITPTTRASRPCYAGATLDVPAQAQATPPLAAPVCIDLTRPHTHIEPDLPLEEIVILDDPARNAAVGPAGVFLDEWPHQGPVPNAYRPANDVLRHIAVHYLHKPNLQVAVIHMEPDQTHGIRVVITLELADL